ncbi:malonyl-ACP O-methyltransferase BioC [Amphritea sp. HPY]|uniref:malonyl-ACP O-methyltransferase BioC n=1 Tax=Amphritea sp. HPY TaxID=3421652 RepID=UPI003D7C57D4
MSMSSAGSHGVTQFAKADIADSFSRAAVSYDAVAELQRSVGTELLRQLPDDNVGVVLDLGCGTGFFGPQLNRTLQPDHLISLDLAQGMLQFARTNRATENGSWLCADAEALPLADSSVDLIFSSLAIQWCENLPALFSEAARVLRPGGRFLFSTLGPDTLNELRSAWSSVDQYQHVNRFISHSTLSESAGNYFAQVAVAEQRQVLLYDEVRGLTNELKGIGAHNISHDRQGGLTGKARITAFKQAYEKFRGDDGKLPATYQVFYGELING